MLFGEGDTFVVDERSVFHGGDTGADCILDAFGSVGVCGDLEAELMSFVDSSLQFFGCELKRVGIAAMSEYGARREQLNLVSSVLIKTANDFANLPRAVGLAIVHIPRK